MSLGNVVPKEWPEVTRDRRLEGDPSLSNVYAPHIKSLGNYSSCMYWGSVIWMSSANMSAKRMYVYTSLFSDGLEA